MSAARDKVVQGPQNKESDAELQQVRENAMDLLRAGSFTQCF